MNESPQGWPVWIYESTARPEPLMETLFGVWQRAVEATHTFLSEEEIERIAAYLPDALRSVGHLLVAESVGEPVAFMGIEGGRLEMLFVEPAQAGKGIGKELLCRAVRNYGVREVCVNEGNPRAREFYEYMGFEVYRRTELDRMGDPYPLLYMRLRE